MKGYKRYDKNIIRLPRQVSFIIIYTFVNLGIVGQNMARRLDVTTFSTTKAWL